MSGIAIVRRHCAQPAYRTGPIPLGLSHWAYRNGAIALRVLHWASLQPVTQRRKGCCVQVSLVCAEARGRTGTPVKAADFESAASANSATSAIRRAHNTQELGVVI